MTSDVVVDVATERRRVPSGWGGMKPSATRGER